MNVSERELMRLLESDGRIPGRRSRHGIFYHKQFDGEPRPRFTVVPDKSAPIPDGALGAILGPRQTGIGRVGLQSLLDAN